MIKGLFKVLGLLVLLLVIALAIKLAPAHYQIRQIEPSLPEFSEILEAITVEGGATEVRYVSTATQARGESRVGYLSVLIQWPDGKRFLLDSGMKPSDAIAFGKMLETLMDADPVEASGALEVLVGDAIQSVKGIGFTHLHSDHTVGITAICKAQESPAPIYQVQQQNSVHNYLTSDGQALIDGADCARAPVSENTINHIPGFSGIVAIPVGGHTPGSTVYVVRVNGHNWIFAGDLTNDMHSLHNNVGKGVFYSNFIVPENTARLGVLRQWLEAIDKRDDSSVLVAHDIGAFESSSIPAWGE